MQLHQTARLLIAAVSLISVGASAQNTAPAATASGQATPTVVVKPPLHVEIVNKTAVRYSNMVTYQFEFSVVPDVSTAGYKFEHLADSWQLAQMNRANLSPELKYITVRVVNNGAVPAAAGSKAELEALGRVMLATVKFQGFDVSKARVLANSAKEGMVDFGHHGKANVMVRISSQEEE